MTDATVPFTRTGKALPVPLGRKLSSTLGSTAGRWFVWLLAFLWTVPTFGLLLTSFRPERQIKTSGWWTWFATPTSSSSQGLTAMPPSPCRHPRPRKHPRQRCRAPPARG